ncbi:DUF2339 domain-containing protein [uncultured Tateyamaria sp.]|uniref:DUF2339 domain-containing protein n=1 Tax=uncultured Tateyamaria sp. TaxID=455651 RepID=UPI00263A09CB|nr:DUF2339 domain-containing protein [uncultured Tateyamaria sp.]
MDGVLVLLGLVVLAIPVAVIYLLVAQSGLRRRIVTLEKDIARMMATQSDAPPRAETKAAETKPREATPATPAPAATPKALDEPAAARVIAARKAAQDKVVKSGPSRAQIVMNWVATNWFYLVSALSLALAGLFLVQYGVENGLFPPAARVLAALAFGAALVGGGEVIRRRYGDGPDSATAYIPSVFSGAGLVSLFGAIAAARLLYDLIGVEVAFAGMAAVGLLGVALGWLHGPLLTTVGVVGAFTAPLLVGSTVPATNWLYLYFGIVTAVGLGVDTLRRWAWVSALSVGLGFGMGWLTVLGGGPELAVGFQLYFLGIVALAVLVPARSVWPDHDGLLASQWAIQPTGPRPGFPTALAAAAVAIATVGIVWTGTVGGAPFWPGIVALVVLAVALALWSLSAPALEDLALLPSVGLLVLVGWQGENRGPVWRAFTDTYTETVEADFPFAVTLLWAIGLGLSAVAAGRALRPGYGLPWALGAALMAPAMGMVIEVTWHPAVVIGAYPWALHAMVLAAVLVAFALRFARVDGADRTRASLFVLSALASISFACVMILSSAALTVALAVTVLVAALLDRRFDLPLMQVMITVGVVAIGARLIADPGLPWALDAPAWELLLAYGGALAAFVAALWALRGKARVTAQLMLDTAAWSTGGTLVSLLLFRLLERLTGVDHNATHWAMGLYATIWLGLMGAQLLRLEGLGGVLSIVRAGLALVFGLIGFGALALGLTILSPLLSDWGGDVAGPPLLNTLLAAYLLPALVLGLIAWRSRFRLLRLALSAVSLALAAFWAFVALRHLWQGASGMELRYGFLQPELYSYTVALLVVGAALFYQSLARGSTVLRRAGLVVIGLAVAKVFLIDISGLEGLTRVLSLVVLGLSLAALAWLNRWAQGRSLAD